MTWFLPLLCHSLMAYTVFSRFWMKLPVLGVAMGVPIYTSCSLIARAVMVLL